MNLFTKIKYKNIRKYSLLVGTFLGLQFLSADAKPITLPYTLSCSNDYRTSKNVVSGASHADIERAGVLLLKDYGSDLLEKDDRYAVLFGYDRGLKKLFPHAGKVEKKDKYSSECAARELWEEGHIKKTAKQIAALPYLYAGQKQLFFNRDDKLSATKITQACQKAIRSNLPAAFKEMNGCVAVSVKELLRLANEIDKNKVQSANGSYTIKSRNGKTFSISAPYMCMFGHRYDHSRYQKAKIMLSDIFGVNF